MSRQQTVVLQRSKFGLLLRSQHAVQTPGQELAVTQLLARESLLIPSSLTQQPLLETGGFGRVRAQLRLVNDCVRRPGLRTVYLLVWIISGYDVDWQFWISATKMSR